MFFSVHNTSFKQHCPQVSLFLTFVVKRKLYWIIIAYEFCFCYFTSYCLQLMFYSFIYLLFYFFICSLFNVTIILSCSVMLSGQTY